MPDNDNGRFSCYHTPLILVCNLYWINFHINTMSVALLVITSFNTIFCFYSNAVTPEKSLIVIILELNFVVQE